MLRPDLPTLPVDRPYPPGMPAKPNGGPVSAMIPDGLNLGREKLPEWTPEIWSRIDGASIAEIDRASVAAQFLPRVASMTPSARTVPANRIDDTDGVLAIDQGNVLALLEVAQLFVLSKEQYYDEEYIGTAATLAARAANRLARAMDANVFLGTASNPGLVGVAGEQHTIPVPPLDDSNPGVYGENIFTAVSNAYAYLQGLNLYGPYALVLPPAEYADAHAPLRSTLIMPADRIRPLMTAGFYASGTLPDRRGVMISLGGTVDLAIAVHGATAFTFVDSSETRRFRIYERFTARVKVPQSLVLLEFA